MALKPRIRVLSNEDLNRVHEASLKVLAETGVAFRHEEALEVFKKHGAKVEGEVVYFTRKMVEEALEKCPSTYTWRARNDEKTVTVGEGFLIQPAFGCVYVQDLHQGRRLGLLEDYANYQKLCQASNVIQLVGSCPVVPSDIDPAKKHLYVLYETIKNTDKPVIGFAANGRQTTEMLDMLEIAFGGKDFLMKNQCIGAGINPLSPLSYGTETLETVIGYTKRNQVLFVNPAPMAGITAPLNLAGAAIMQNAEILACIVLIQLINPGVPVVYCPAAVVGNMKRASFCTGSPEGMLINIANLQLGLDLYHLPTRTLCGHTDAKIVDSQSGYETMQSLMTAMLGGAQIINEALGTLDSYMAVSFDKFIIDEELYRRVLRISEGIDTSDEAFSLDIIKEVGHGGSYLMHPYTFEHFRDYWLPTVSDWESFADWKKAGEKNTAERANKKYKDILANAPESMIDSELDKELKAYMKKVC